MGQFKEWDIEARDAFHLWEAENESEDFSDRDINIWCAGYVEAKLIQQATDNLNKAEQERVSLQFQTRNDLKRRTR